MEATWAYYGPVSCGTRTMIGTDAAAISSGSSTREDTAASSRRAATWMGPHERPSSRSSRGIMARARGPPKIDSPDYVRVDFISCFKRCHSIRTGRPPDLIARSAPIWRFLPVPFLSLFSHNALLSRTWRGPILGNRQCDELQAMTEQSWLFSRDILS